MDTREIAVRLMNSVFDANYERRIEWFIWAAKASKCPKCDNEPYIACSNLTVRRRHGREVPTKGPHMERVDWRRFLMGLRDRGYIDEAVYARTLKQMEAVE